MRYALINDFYAGEIASSGYCVLRADQNLVLPKWIQHCILQQVSNCTWRSIKRFCVSGYFWFQNKSIWNPNPLPRKPRKITGDSSWNSPYFGYIYLPYNRAYNRAYRTQKTIQLLPWSVIEFWSRRSWYYRWEEGWWVHSRSWFTRKPILRKRVLAVFIMVRYTLITVHSGQTKTYVQKSFQEGRKANRVIWLSLTTSENDEMFEKPLLG